MRNLADLLYQIPVLLFSLTIHEYCHGLAAYYLGDDTAKRAGRLSLNPIIHIDPIGLIMLFIAHIGWAKPVPINPHNFQNYKRDTAITAAAGPAANFVVAITLSLIFNLLMRFLPASVWAGAFSQFIMSLLYYAILINVALGIFNLIPLPPLDGSKILGGFLTDRQYIKFAAKEREGAMILLILFAADSFLGLHIISSIIRIPIQFFMSLLLNI